MELDDLLAPVFGGQLEGHNHRLPSNLLMIDLLSFSTLLGCREQQAEIAETMKKLNATRHPEAATEGGLRCPDQQIVKDQRRLLSL